MSAQTLAITGLGHRGEGVANHEGKPVFVPLTLPGETVRAELDGTRGRLLDIVTSAPERVDPYCSHFGQCGGCQLQHMAQPAYADWKRDLVVDALARAGLAAEVLPLVVALGAGRRRATLHATPTKAGFMGVRSHQIHDLDTCPILVPALATAPAIARAIAAQLGPCDVGFTASAVGLDVSVHAKGAKPKPGLAGLAETFDLARLALNGEVILNYRTPYILMGDAQVPLPVGSFLQATEAAETALGGLVVAAAKGSKAVADLFCGLGPFALRLAAQGPVYAADSDKPAILALDAARRGAKGLKALTAERRDLFREPLTRFELNRFDCVVIDPPRAGAQAQARELAGSKVKTIISVSCDPRSFVRDAAILIAGGYRMGVVTPLDQFAWSAHVEVFAVFTR